MAKSTYTPNRLNLAEIHPNNHPKYSPNLHAFLGSPRAKHILRLGHVYKDATGTMWLGYLDDTNSLIGARLSMVLCYGRKAQVFSHCALPKLQEVENFWEQYVADGRCAIDREHTAYFIGDESRWDVLGNLRNCRWCGKAKQVLRHWSKTTTVEESSWCQATEGENSRVSVSA